MLDCKVFEIGMMRTGTRSLARAAQLLGYSAIHAPTRKTAEEFYQSVISGEFAPEFINDHQYVGGCAAPFWDRLLDRYPTAKFILTTRDKRSWLRSCHAMTRHTNMPPLRELVESKSLSVKMLMRLLFFRCADVNEEAMWSAYLRHQRSVLLEVPTDRLLVIDVTKPGQWNKLCPFLGCGVPDWPFPHMTSCWTDISRQTA